MNAAPVNAGPPPTPPRALVAGLALLALGAGLLVFHNYGCPILPRKQFALPAAQLRPLSAGRPHVFVVPFDHSEPNRPGVDRSAVRLLEDGVSCGNAMRNPAELMEVGDGRWVHEPGRILFSTAANRDPRSNGHTYALLSPVLYTRAIAQGSALVFLLATAGLCWCARRRPAVAPVPRAAIRWRGHLAGATLLFLAGLYCNTGTLSPYAITIFPHVAKGTGYLYNPDHVHFRALSDFAQGAERSRWDGAIMLRRILFPVLAWPLVKVAGFEVGGTLASLALNGGALLWCAHLLRRRVGERGAAFALWLLALYPGAAYWGGLPYPYALISPLSPLLLLGLQELAGARGKRLVALSLAMGIAYLAYDFAIFFLPATLLLLGWQRRFAAALLSCGWQLLPLVAWVFILARVFHQPPENSNTTAYHQILAAYHLNWAGAQPWVQLGRLPETVLTVFFGANFIFLPGLFLLLLAINPLTSRVRLARAEAALLLAALGIFLFNHFAPPYAGWQMRGTWIARLYQPVFPVLVFFAARWWQELPPLRRPVRLLLGGALAGVVAGNALIVFGPILNNPLRLSETAYYRFYNHLDRHFVYQDYCLKVFGRHPLGFPAPQP